MDQACRRCGRRSLAAVLLALLALSPAAESASKRLVPPRQEKHSPAGFDQALRENALFFSLLVSFSFTASVSRPAWGVGVRDINVNLISRAVRDAQGRQMIRARVAGVVRNNYNVELDILDDRGVRVGRGFFGYQSGQLTFYDAPGRAIIDGFIDSRGNFALDDLRLPAGKQDLGAGFVDPCFVCSSFAYGWYDAANVQIGGGRMYPTYSVGTDRIRMIWTVDRGKLTESIAAAGEAEYDLAGETKGAINSVLFDTTRSAASFFANPYSLVPEPVGRALVPRFTNDTGIAVTNPNNREIEITYVARKVDGSLISGSSFENPVTYRFSAGQQYAAYPDEIFAADGVSQTRVLLGSGEVGWIEIFSDDDPIQAFFLDGDTEGKALDGNVAAESGGNPIVFSDLRVASGETTEIELLNLAFDDAVVRLELRDRDGSVLREEREFFLPGYTIRTFRLGAGSDFLQPADWSSAATLQVSCNNSNAILSTACSKIVGLATFTDRFGSLATSYAVSAETSGTTLAGAYFVAGSSWESTVRITKLDGSSAPVSLEVYDRRGALLESRQATLAPGGQATFKLDASAVPSGSSLLTGYVRVRSDSGKIGGDVAISWSPGASSQSTTYPLASSLSDVLQFNQVAEGISDRTEYWTGLALMNDRDGPVDVTVTIYRADGTVDRTLKLTLEAYAQRVGLLSELLGEKGTTRLSGYIRVTATRPMTAIVLYGDTASEFLSAIPAIAR